QVTSVQIACNADGTTHWTATVFNMSASQIVAAHAAVLWVHTSPSPLPVQRRVGTTTFQPGTNVVQGDFCYSSGLPMHATFALLTSSCIAYAASGTIAPCPVQPTCPLPFRAM